jgi:DNA (cytosine-5)-methyltransferase 1
MVDLFAGPGGIDVAARKLGIETVGLEWDDDANATRVSAGLENVFGDVRDYGPEKFPDQNVLAGGPPCQTFTVAGNGTGRKALDDVQRFIGRMLEEEPDWESITADLRKIEDDRTGLVLEPLRWILQALEIGRPYQAIVLEQVPAVLPVWKSYEAALYDRGYIARSGILRTEEFGVPQTRRRAVLIARYGEVVELPKPTHRPYRKGVPRGDDTGRPAPWRTMGEILPHRGKFIVTSNYGTGGDPKARGTRTWDQPSATVTGKIFRNRIHWENGGEQKRFTPSEAGRLQTFPSNYPWSGGDIGQQIGNAVPPRLAMHVLCAALGMPEPSNDQLESLDTWDVAPVSLSKRRDAPRTGDGTAEPER